MSADFAVAVADIGVDSPNVSNCSNEILCTAEPSPNTAAAADSAISQYAAPGYTATCRT
ncbi:Uncharacterised protein [Mycobacteroides abscessus subsp. abscessus]|nr:Uncharacterised protein [Mycobacteroides abscessus subsp. abscessus]